MEDSERNVSGETSVVSQLPEVEKTRVSARRFDNVLSLYSGSRQNQKGQPLAAGRGSMDTVDQRGPLELATGSTFRGLIVHNLLGEGGMGSVYLASHPILQIPLIIKTLRPCNGMDVFREAYLAARVMSLHTVRVHDAGFEGDYPFIVQSYVDGIDMSELLSSLRQSGRKLPRRLWFRFLRHAAKGLHGIHQAGVVHCDVKPSNLFLGGNGQVMIGDFGIAKPTRPSGEDVLTGTPAYMAPEQWLDLQVDRRTDIYGLGATAHYLITHQAPFPSEDVDQQREAHLHKPYRPILADEPSEAFFHAVIQRMLKKKPENRFPNAGDVADAMAKFDKPVLEYQSKMDGSYQIGDLHLNLRIGDIAFSEADVIANASNVDLTMEHGCGAALRREGGEEIEREAMKSAPAAMGDVIWTKAGKLRAQYVAHAIAAAKGAVCLQRCTLRVLLEAERCRLRSVALPVFGTGVAKVSMEHAAQLMLEAIRTFAELEPVHIQSIEVALYTEDAFQSWTDIIQAM